MRICDKVNTPQRMSLIMLFHKIRIQSNISFCLSYISTLNLIIVCQLSPAWAMINIEFVNVTSQPKLFHSHPNTKSGREIKSLARFWELVDNGYGLENFLQL